MMKYERPLKLLIAILLIVALALFSYVGMDYLLDKSRNTSSSSIKSTTSASSTASGKCIITIDGSKYDVTTFRYQHPGGDVFACGTDMSSEFHRQHSQSALRQMRQYKVS